MGRICITGGGAALAQYVIKQYLDCDLDYADEIVAVCRRNRPDIGHEFLRVKSRLQDAEGPFDTLITFTGSAQSCKLKDMTEEEWRVGVEDNLTSVWQALSQGLGKVRDGGNVVVVGSIVGSTGGYGCASYAAAKAGLVGLVRAAANENADRQICVNLLELGYIDAGMGARLDPKVKEKVTPTIPLKRFGTEEDVFEAVDYLSRVRYMTGGILTLAGGLR